jgi:hypothetical protein
LATKYILAALAIIFFSAAAIRLLRTRNSADLAARTWVIIAVIFAAVSGWLWFLDVTHQR